MIFLIFSVLQIRTVVCRKGNFHYYHPFTHSKAIMNVDVLHSRQETNTHLPCLFLVNFYIISLERREITRLVFLLVRVNDCEVCFCVQRCSVSLSVHEFHRKLITKQVQWNYYLVLIRILQIFLVFILVWLDSTWNRKINILWPYLKKREMYNAWNHRQIKFQLRKRRELFQASQMEVCYFGFI